MGLLTCLYLLPTTYCLLLTKDRCIPDVILFEHHTSHGWVLNAAAQTPNTLLFELKLSIQCCERLQRSLINITCLYVYIYNYTNSVSRQY